MERKKLRLLRRKTRKAKKDKKGKAKKNDEAYEGDEALTPLLDEKGDATRNFKQCLVALFKRFDVDGDNLLSESELKAFSREANPDEREFSVDELEEMHEFFDWKESGSAGVAGLTLRGWLQMYVTQTASDEGETWRDLRQLGYDGDLQLVTSKTEGKRPRSSSLCAALERFVALGEAGDVDAFVKAFVATDIDEEDRAAYSTDLQKDDNEQLRSLLDELRCCSTGRGVFMIEEKKKKKAVTIHFHSPAPGAERVDRAVTFIRDGDE